MGDEEERGEETWRGDVASHPGFILIPAESLLRAPVVQHYGGETEGPQRREGGWVARECVEGENEKALILFPGDLWS